MRPTGQAVLKAYLESWRGEEGVDCDMLESKIGKTEKRDRQGEKGRWGKKKE